MESKVNRCLLLKQFLASFAHARQNAISDGHFENAMTHHFFFLLHADEYLELKKSMNSKETSQYFEAMLCLDYRNL